MRTAFSTAHAEPAERKSAWSEAVSRTYFPLELGFRPGPAFSGALEVWNLGDLAISRNVSDGLVYRRHARHLLHAHDESFLITVPERAEVSFRQDGKDVRCRPGAFLIERSHLPYEFAYTEPNALWVLKVPSPVLRARIGAPERLATLSFDATQGVGALFVDMLRLTAPRVQELDEAGRAMAGRHLVDLLALAVEADPRTLGSQASSVQGAHLHRVERYIRANLARADLGPQGIAEACGLSVRYLHQLFETQGTSVCGFVRRQRLAMCDEALRDPACRRSLSEIAYRWGFGDQAQFSRQYRAEFGCTPREARASARG
ncbi:helix-turn-helix domain-containing protein [Methylobacterium indicum]|uniref:AraC family transcriptional regulator n=1 Tax=Methylobacterium indicum TaxID=1775910 RepID=A0ABR5HIB2_9HYPH|nr:helix-turn-helix domain-containing protein [Methylobacterium indicum]KMO20747.1 AraC family transcriptional regulator [Methylobacterium indicum]KMO26446.1 AraC family transcriptional regulator [Methylobacterium indicum]